MQNTPNAPRDDKGHFVPPDHPDYPKYQEFVRIASTYGYD